ncbi:hypothetical protein EYF80_041081 [Liparis tanakae]|uniref:Uncharacterized protein n=1 Tax=Liparis tanakae TaxID=230148 RepID=A0A4Z2G720_9TELE|nr:hypothetical protein EYF80_041081 [Liparis tanakae]
MDTGSFKCIWLAAVMGPHGSRGADSLTCRCLRPTRASNLVVTWGGGGGGGGGREEGGRGV